MAAATPTVIGNCRYCTLELYTAGPTVVLADGNVAHIACHRHEHRSDR